MMLGYYGNSDATNVIIRIHEGGCVFISGRIKRMIVRYDGFKVFPAFIEEKMLTCKRIDNCSCVSKNDEIHVSGQLPVVFYTLKNKTDNVQSIENDLRDIAKKLLPDYSQPCDYKYVGELPRTHAGKVDYRKLESMC